MSSQVDNNSLIKSSGINGVTTERSVTAHVECPENSERSEEVKTILVVDDSEDISGMVRRVLEHHGYEVIIACDGQEGLNMAQANKPDLIVLDLMLPKLNGYKVCGLLKRDVRYSKIPIILFTSTYQEQNKKFVQDIGCDAYLKKPLNAQIMIATIRELING